ncbi:hypothetical protein GKZ68_10315 [Hymenobacter sp. BRD128]|uniref:hypothetical protein n=1 Tax=Hymenobacter sp. BRD128 TaxID=2675878 RepID=UPI0015641AF6|nr:hypothetical protein [Hymenobacter sp. BRD128]QKG56984.1 hypothetical protein GKZ68_10315 [Hymenobacter sp. BRD128]
MKFFLIFFAVATLVCGYFLLTDGPGSGMGWPTGIFAALGAGVALYNWRTNGSPLDDSTKR